MTKARELAELGAVYDSGALSNRNLIINGNFQVWQRGTSMSSTINGFTMETADRWYVVRSLLNQETDTWGNPYAHVVCGNYADSNYLQHKVEFPRKLAGKTLTLSFWMKSDDGLGADGSVYIRNFDGVGYNVHVNFESFTFGTEWKQFTFTFDIPESTTFGSDESYGLEIFIYGNVSSTNQNGKSFDMKEVQLELGPEATPFEHRSYGDELARCQRYYFKYSSDSSSDGVYSVGNAYNTSTASCAVSLPVGLRSKPTLGFTNQARIRNGSGSSQGVNTLAVNGWSNDAHGSIVQLTGTTTTTNLTTGDAAQFRIGLNDYIEFDAEL